MNHLVYHQMMPPDYIPPPVPATTIQQVVIYDRYHRPQNSFFIRFWPCPSLRKNGYYMLDFADINDSRTRINKPKGIEIVMVSQGFKVRSRLDIDLERMQANPREFGKRHKSEIKIPPGSETFIIYGGAEHVLTYGDIRIHSFIPPEVSPSAISTSQNQFLYRFLTESVWTSKMDYRRIIDGIITRINAFVSGKYLHR